MDSFCTSCFPYAFVGSSTVPVFPFMMSELLITIIFPSAVLGVTVTGTSTDCSVPSIFMVRVCLTAASVVLGFAVTVTVVPFTVADKIPDNPETVNDLPSAFASVTFISWFPPLSVKVIVLGQRLLLQVHSIRSPLSPPDYVALTEHSLYKSSQYR